MTKKVKKLSENNESIDPEIEEVIANVCKIQGTSKQQKYFMYKTLGLADNTASKLAGYSEQYGYQLNQKWRNNPKWREGLVAKMSKMPDAYRLLCQARLPVVGEIEGKGLEEYLKDPKKAIEKPGLLRDIKRAGGVDLSESDVAKPVTMVNIQKMQVACQKTVGDMLTKKLGGDVVTEDDV